MSQAPSPRTMNRGVPPTALNPRTGELTPPGVTASARPSSSSDRGVAAGYRAGSRSATVTPPILAAACEVTSRRPLRSWLSRGELEQPRDRVPVPGGRRDPQATVREGLRQRRVEETPGAPEVDLPRCRMEPVGQVLRRVDAVGGGSGRPLGQEGDEVARSVIGYAGERVRRHDVG